MLPTRQQLVSILLERSEVAINPGVGGIKTPQW